MNELIVEYKSDYLIEHQLEAEDPLDTAIRLARSLAVRGSKLKSIEVVGHQDNPYDVETTYYVRATLIFR